jgi:hypothetical protein
MSLFHSSENSQRNAIIKISWAYKGTLDKHYIQIKIENLNKDLLKWPHENMSKNYKLER